MTVVRLAWQELRGLARGRFTLLAAASILAFMGAIAATVGLSSAPRQFYWPVFAMGPLILLPVAAWHVAAARSTRFLHAVFTTRVSQTQYMMSQLVAMLLLGALYLAAALPFLAVEAFHVGVSDAMVRYFLMGVGSVCYCAGLGVLIGFAFTSRGSAAPLGAAVTAMVGSAAGLIFLDTVIFLEEGSARTFLLRALHLAVGVVLSDALQLGWFPSAAPASALLAYLVMVGGVVACAWWIFVRRQSPEGWNLRPGQAVQVALAIGLVLLTPAVIASTDYGPVQPPERLPNTEMTGLWVHVVERGGAPDSGRSFYGHDRIVAKHANEVDLLLFIYPYPERPEPFREVEVRLWGENLSVVPTEHRVASGAPLDRAWPHSRMGMDWLYVRVPATLTPATVEHLGDNPHVLGANVSYVDANGTAWSAQSTILLYSDVPNAQIQMALVGLPMPLLAVIWDVRRRIQTR